MILTGYAAVFNSLSTDLGGFVETIAPGAFARTLREHHQYAIHYHNYSELLGSTRSGTLKLSEDKRGLYFELNMPDTSLGRDVHALVKRRDLVHMSFSFRVNGAAGEKWRELPSGLYERTLIDVDLTEVSTVVLPAYRATTVSTRSTAAVVPIRSGADNNRMLRQQMQKRLQAATRR